MSENSSSDNGGFTVPLEPALAQIVRSLALAIRARGGRLLLVGGCVRDALLGAAPKDADAEVFGIPAAELDGIVTRFVKVDWVGRSFGVLKVRHLPLDISMPRRERKTGEAHTDFLVTADPFMTPREAAARRDFTINAISWDPLTGEIVDPYDGRADLAQSLLRHTSERFAEDPLRVLRAMQFAARFNLSVAPETLALCRTLSMKDISRERVGDEWQKLLVQGKTPSLGLEFLRACGWVRFFPELEALIGCPQDPKWHPEGDVWTHTLHALDAFARARTGDAREDWIVGLAVLCHDLGKPSTTQQCEDGHIRSWGHDLAGEAPARALLARLTAEKEVIETVVILVTHHMRILELYQVQAGDAAIRRLAQKVERLDRLVRVDDADRKGRPPVEWGASPQAQWILERAEALSLKDRAPKPILQGRHLIAHGLKPSPAFKPILAAAFEAQLDGAFSDEPGAVKWLTDYLATQQPKA